MRDIVERKIGNMQPVVQEEIHVLVIRVVTSGLNPFASGHHNVSCGRNNINVNGCTHFILTSAANCTGAWRHLQIFQPTNWPLSVSLAIEWHLHWHLLDHRNIIFFLYIGGEQKPWGLFKKNTTKRNCWHLIGLYNIYLYGF